MKVNMSYASIGALTPELGGIFTDLRLKIKPFFKKEKSDFMISAAREIAKTRNVKLSDISESDPELIDKFADKVLELIDGWENLTDSDGNIIECTDETKKKLIYPMLFERVEVVKEKSDTDIKLSEILDGSNEKLIEKITNIFDQKINKDNNIPKMSEAFTNLVKEIREEIKKEEKETVTLSVYIVNFAGDMRNYIKN